MRIRVMAPVCGTVAQLLAEQGATVKQGDEFMEVESMKMLFPAVAPTDGVLEMVAKLGETVDETSVLAYIVKNSPA
jgi:biotin carboxyl carrier protein